MEEKLKDERGWHLTMIDNAVLESNKLNTYDKLTYIMICMHGNRNVGTCFPSLNTLAKLVCCSKPTIIKSIKTLEEIGLIEVEQRWNDKNEYLSNIYVIKDVNKLLDKLK